MAFQIVFHVTPEGLQLPEIQASSQAEEKEAEGLLHPIRDWAGHRRFRQDELDEFLKKLLAGEIGEAAQG